MDIIDEKGRVFGRVNIFDLFVIMLLFAVAVAIGSFVLGPAPANHETTVELRATVEPFIADHIKPGIVESEDVLEIHSVEKVGVSYQVDLHRGIRRRLSDLSIVAALPTDIIQVKNSRQLAYRSKRLYVGREFTVDLDETIITVVVADIKQTRERRDREEVSS